MAIIVLLVSKSWLLNNVRTVCLNGVDVNANGKNLHLLQWICNGTYGYLSYISAFSDQLYAWEIRAKVKRHDYG